MTRKPQDFELWTEVAKSVKPLRKQAAGKKAPATKLRAAPRAAHPKPAIVPPPAAARSPPPLTGFDRRTSQKFTRGNVDIEARIDLHGTGIEMARVRLLRFLAEARHQGNRTVLVITGKGDSPFSRHTLHGKSHYDAPERQGKLRRHLPEWLHEAEFRALVSGFQPAHPKHGGGGAFYVRLRRDRTQP